MKKRYLKFPYEKEYISEIDIKKEIKDKKYTCPKESIIFPGNDNVSGDKYKINSLEPDTVNILGTDYYYNEEETVKMNIDYENRLDIMQQNLGCAILRSCINKSTNLKITNYKINENINKIYINAKDIPFKTLMKIEDLANYIISANLLVRVFDDVEKIDIKGMGNISYTGPCLRRTGEVALIKVENVEKENDNIVLNILCGQRAILDYRKKSLLLDNIKSILFLDSEDKILSEIKSLKSNGETLKKENKKMEEELNLDGVKEYKNSATTVEGIHYIYKIERNVNFKELKFICHHIMNDLNYIQVYGIPNGPTSQVLVARSKNLNVDLKDIYNNMLNKFTMTGTGNMMTVQANVNSVQLPGVMENFLVEIKKRLGDLKITESNRN